MTCRTRGIRATCGALVSTNNAFREVFDSLPEFAVVFQVTFPEFFYKRQHFLHVLPTVTLRETRPHPIEFALIGARPEAEFKPPVA